MQHQPPAPNSEQSKLIAYLDEFGKQVHSRKNNNNALEEQLLSLSKAYNQAQQKLLQTERALMAESILVEKQRSVMEIYRYILSEQMEDQGIITFIQQLEQEQPNTEIFHELAQIKTVLSRKNIKKCKKNLEESRTLESLKKEVTRLGSERREVEENSEVMSDQNYQLQLSLKQAQQQLCRAKQQLENSKSQLTEKDRLIHSLNQSKNKDAQSLTNKSIRVQQLITKEQQLKRAEQFIKEMSSMLQTKLSLKVRQQKQNTSHNTPITALPHYKDKNFINHTQQKINQLLKYKLQYKKMKDNSQTTAFLQRQVTLLKLFLSEQSLALLKQFQDKKLDCIESQIRNLAILQKTRIMKLQDSEKDVWKYKLQLMKEDEQSSLQLINSLFSRDGARMPETFRQSAKNKRPGMESTIANEVSQFDS